MGFGKGGGFSGGRSDVDGNLKAQGTISCSSDLQARSLTIQDGRSIGVNGYTDLLSLSSGQLTVNGNTTVSGVLEVINGTSPQPRTKLNIQSNVLEIQFSDGDDGDSAPGMRDLMRINDTNVMLGTLVATKLTAGSVAGGNETTGHLALVGGTDVTNGASLGTRAGVNIFNSGDLNHTSNFQSACAIGLRAFNPGSGSPTAAYLHVSGGAPAAGSTTDAVLSLIKTDIKQGPIGGNGYIFNGSWGSQTKFQVSASGEIISTYHGNRQTAITAALPPGTGFGAGSVYKTHVSKRNGIVHTQIYLNLSQSHQGPGSSGNMIYAVDTSKVVLSNEKGSGSAVSNTYFTKLNTSINGYVFKAQMICLETPANAKSNALKIGLAANPTAIQSRAAYDSAGTAVEILDQKDQGMGAWTAGAVGTSGGDDEFNDGLHDHYVYLFTKEIGGGADNSFNEYSAGQYLIEFWGVDALDP